MRVQISIGGVLPPQRVYDFLAILKEDDFLIEDFTDSKITLSNLTAVLGDEPANFETENVGNSFELTDFCQKIGLWYKCFEFEFDTVELTIYDPITGDRCVRCNDDKEPLILLADLEIAKQQGKTLDQLLTSYDWLDAKGPSLTLGKGDLQAKPDDFDEE